MGRSLYFVLEHDGENPIRNDFISDIDDFSCSPLRGWEDLYGGNIMSAYSYKKDSLKTAYRSKGYGGYSWGVDRIAPQIKALREELKLDTSLGYQDKAALKDIIMDDGVHGQLSPPSESSAPSNMERMASSTVAKGPYKLRPASTSSIA